MAQHVTLTLNGALGERGVSRRVTVHATRAGTYLECSEERGLTRSLARAACSRGSAHTYPYTSPHSYKSYGYTYCEYCINIYCTPRGAHRIGGSLGVSCPQSASRVSCLL